MDLISTVYIPKGELDCKTSQIPLPERWFHESTTKCAISHRNIVAFVSLCPLTPSCASGDTAEDDQNPLQFKKESSQKIKIEKQVQFSGQYFVYVCDLNTPWDILLVTANDYPITALEWDKDNGNTFVLADSTGQVEIWQMKESLLSEWHWSS